MGMQLTTNMRKKNHLNFRRWLVDNWQLFSEPEVIMRVITETNELGTHYEFICYYEDKRVALLGNTLDTLLNSYAVKMLACLVC